MGGEYATGLNEALCFHRQTFCRAGITSRVSLCGLVPSGRLLHPTTSFKIQLINDLCVRRLSKNVVTSALRSKSVPCLVFLSCIEALH